MQYLLTPHGKDVALKTFAGVGFITVIGVSFWLAAYAINNIPSSIIDRAGSAAVYLGSIFTPKEAPTNPLVPVATSTTPLIDDKPAATSTPSTDPVTPVPGEKTEDTYPIGGDVSAPGTLYGFPDLTVVINTTGYLTTTSTDSFVASSTVPYGMRPAVRFSVINQGTNIAAAWRFSASIPTQSAYVFASPMQQPLAPGDSIEYVLGFDQATPGTNKMISITANSDSTVGESTHNNNSASAQITILGS